MPKLIWEKKLQEALQRQQRFGWSGCMSKQLKKELKEQLDQINKKMQFELEFFRQEMKPLKNQKQQLLERLSELK